jgi:hypothetical protein
VNVAVVKEMNETAAAPSRVADEKTLESWLSRIDDHATMGRLQALTRIDDEDAI